MNFCEFVLLWVKQMNYELWPSRRTVVSLRVHVLLISLLFLSLSFLDCREILLPLMTEQLKFHLDKEEEPRACCQLLSDVLEVLYRKDVVRTETPLNAFYQPLPLCRATLYLTVLVPIEFFASTLLKLHLSGFQRHSTVTAKLRCSSTSSTFILNFATISFKHLDVK